MQEFDFPDLEREFVDMRDEWERLFRELMRPVEQLLLKLARERFDKLSAGLVAWGDRWMANHRDDPRRRAIGLITGRMRDSLEARIRHSAGRISFRLRYEAVQAAAFNKLRPLLPERIPKEWADQINELLEQQLAKFEDVLKARGLID